MTDSKNKTCSQCGCIHAQRHHYHFVLNTGADQTKQGDASSGSSLEWTHTFSCGNGETQQISESVHKPNEHYKKEDQGEARITSGIPIVALSWQHGHNYGSDFAVMNSLLLDRGIAMAFAEEVEWSSFTGHHKAGRTPVAELEIPILDRYGLLYWTKLRMTAHPITDLQIENDLLVDWTVLESANTSPGFCLIAETGTHFDLSIDWDMPFRLVFYADFVVNTKGLAVDGNFIGGKLPTGVSGGGGTFRSWFFFSEAKRYLDEDPIKDVRDPVIVKDPFVIRDPVISRPDPIKPIPDPATPTEKLFDVYLRDAGAQKINTIKVVREITGLGLKEAKALVDSAPSVVLRRVSNKDAEGAVKLLKNSGAIANHQQT